MDLPPSSPSGQLNPQPVRNVAIKKLFMGKIYTILIVSFLMAVVFYLLLSNISLQTAYLNAKAQTANGITTCNATITYWQNRYNTLEKNFTKDIP